MSRLYGDTHRQLQDEFNTRKLADTVEGIILKNEVDDGDKKYIESRDMFFLATVDHNGRPTVSYKGGDPGFVKVIDSRTILFPSYDGNGMFLSMGNISQSSQIGMLFIDFEKPHRLRLQGIAALSREPDHMRHYKEADFVVKVTVSDIFRNCPRYIHRYKKVDPSEFVPREECETPIPDWKRLDVMQPILPDRDQGKAEQTGGTLTINELQAREKRSD